MNQDKEMYDANPKIYLPEGGVAVGIQLTTVGHFLH